MRRFISLLVAVLSVAATSACAGGGDVLSTTKNPTPTSVIVSVPGPENIARVLPGQSLPLSAVQTFGSTNGTLTGNNYIWTATLTSGGTYVFNSAGATKPCGVVTQTTAGVATPYTADFSIFITIDPVNEANVLFSPPPSLIAPAGSTLTTNYPYCVTVTAQVAGTNPPVRGSITVAVVDPLNPLQ